MNLETVLQSLSGSSALWGPFGMLLLCGLGLPVPEDIVLLAAGFLGAENSIPLMKVIVVMYVGILLGDGIVYSVGRYFGRGVLQTKVGRFFIKEESLGKAESYFTKYGSGVIFVGRFLPGLRAPIFFSAGILRFRVFHFFFMDGLAALVSAPFFVWIGHWAHQKYAENLGELQGTLGRTKLIVGIVVAVVGLLAIIFWRRKNRPKKNLATSQEGV